jgi:pimeloyl-ACP methyl ester carboxylesterase
MQSRVTGDGAALVLVGGGLTGWASWEPHARRLAATRKVVRLQPLNVQAGLENTPLPPNYSVKTEGRAIAASLDGLAVTEPIDVVGWSFGGGAALDFALDHPHRIRTLTLIEPLALWVLHATGTLDDEARAHESALETLQGDISEFQLEQFLVIAGFSGLGGSLRDMPQWPEWSRHRQSLRNSTAVVRHSDSAARLDAFSRPVLLVKGTGSSKFLHQIIDAMATRLRRAKVVEMPTGHGPHIVSIDGFLQALAAFQREAAPP